MEPGFGERREEALKMAGIKTFFITKTIKPVINHSDFLLPQYASVSPTSFFFFSSVIQKQIMIILLLIFVFYLLTQVPTKKLYCKHNKVF